MMAYADVNGIKLYYQTYGTGRPLILLHGGLGAIEMFGENIAALAKGRQVIGVDLQGHGRTADIDRPLSAQLMADDIAALIKHLKLERPDIMGFSSVAASPSTSPSGIRRSCASSSSCRRRFGAMRSIPTSSRNKAR